MGGQVLGANVSAGLGEVLGGDRETLWSKAIALRGYLYQSKNPAFAGLFGGE